MAPSTERRDQQLSVIGHRQSSGKWRTVVFAAIIAAIILGVIQFLVLPSYRENGAGFDKRTLWDWLDVLIFPTVLAIGAVLYDWREKRRDAKLEESEQQRQQLTMKEQTQAAALQAYLDQMSYLLVNQQLRSCTRNSDACRLAEARTLTILLNLDGVSKRHPLKLIARLELIDKDTPLLSLKNAGLDTADLSEVTLLDVSLREADLRLADLTGANLSRSDLTWADLRGADLRRAMLTDACLAHANLLPYDRDNPAQLNAPHLLDGSDPSELDARRSKRRRLMLTRLDSAALTPTRLDGANLQGADLPCAFLYRANLARTNLIGTDLRRADLRGAVLANADLKGALLADADLRGTDLTEANLRDVDLASADLGDADLTGADLRGAILSSATGVTKDQLEQQAISLEGATMPDGTVHD
jgi:uncharacterized protein YjbI with pentapeptide repeats